MGLNCNQTLFQSACFLRNQFLATDKFSLRKVDKKTETCLKRCPSGRQIRSIERVTGLKAQCVSRPEATREDAKRGAKFQELSPDGCRVRCRQWQRNAALRQRQTKAHRESHELGPHFQWALVSISRFLAGQRRTERRATCRGPPALRKKHLPNQSAELAFAASQLPPGFRGDAIPICERHPVGHACL